ncbi:anthranilate phosphoribosyltransferase [Sphingosinicella sp. LY1275]|uniref:anthranilate phosphoribosyltransferase n=1 Tax=Sphingosinicella sp. LY1275 TaxID=3095379 RepID=UPI002ADEEDC6|nr:anthranilate phosphoribosyltransferase [Sphingosinicella sp. LY1275]MEA1015629.1 anthranilate phosphoribosyltransferase [Sphingosinicella sp. LY1275]
MYMNASLAPAAATSFPDAHEEALSRLYAGHSLGEAEAHSLFEALVDGRLDDPTMAAMLIALRLKGETAPELTGAARALRAADAPFPRPDYLFADTCGTGGDGSGSINVSTAAAFVAAACGLPVAKHGNRSITSRCGSADVLEQLGARLDIPAGTARRALDETGICFLLAPLYHPGLKHAGPVRRALKVRTIMNILGPCVNPAEPQVQLLGVADPRMIAPVAETLAALGVGRALVVHGAGLDEIALHGESEAILLADGAMRSLRLSPEQAGLQRRPLATIKGAGPEENAARLSALLKGEGAAAETEVVALNAGALLMTAGLAADLGGGVALALDAIRSGTPSRHLKMFVEATND